METQEPCCQAGKPGLRAVAMSANAQDPRGDQRAEGELTLPYESQSSGAGPLAGIDRSQQDTASLDPALAQTDTHGDTPRAVDDAGRPLPDVPGYQVLRRVARGGMGEVLEARHQVLDRTVAIKMPLAQQITCQADRERFLREARSAAQLRHPHICAIHEVGQSEDCPYIVMDFIRGQTLKDWRKSREPTARQAAELVAVLARAVAYAHQHGVIHRDLKPSNVLVDSETGAPVLTDFGLAKQMDDAASQLTHSGQVMGTPAYMSPEQAAGRLDLVGPCSDVYSLGAVLYELLCGRPPFDGTVGEVLWQVQAEEPQPPRAVNPRIHRDLETICLKALAKEIPARYESAAALADDLERFSAGEPIRARRLGRAARLARAVRRRPAMATAVVAVAVSLALAGWLGTKAAGNSKLTRLTQAFEVGLDHADWPTEHLEQMERLAGQFELLSKTQADAARQRLYQRYAEVHRELLRKPVLEPTDGERIEQALALIEPRSPELAESLRKAYNERQRAWETVADLRSGKRADSMFPHGTVTSQDDRFVLPGPAAAPGQPAGVVYSDLESVGNTELEAEFAESWRQAGELGLVLNALVAPNAAPVAAPAAALASRGEVAADAAYSGYTFRLRIIESTPSAEGAPSDAPAKTFATARRKGEQLTLEILRDKTRLAGQSLDAKAIAAGPLRLIASRHGDRVSVQVNDLPPLVFQDIFPLSRARPGVFALLWPTGVELQSLRGRRQKLPPASSALERGDQLYSSGKFAEALDAYQAEAIASVGTTAAQEARYKEALCLAALHRPEAGERLERLASEPGDRWPVLAACDVWLADLRARRFDEADAVFEGLSARYQFEQLAVLIPSQARTEILTFYGQQATAFGHYTHDPKRIEHLRRATDVEALLGPSGHVFYSASWNLLRSLEADDRLDEALELAEKMVGPGGPWENLAPSNWLEDDAWLLCLGGRADEALARIDRRIFDASGKHRENAAGMLFGRARVLATLGRWDEAEQSLDDWFQSTTMRDSYSVYAMASLVRGFLREHRGDTTGAIEAWRSGYSPDDVSVMTGTVLVANLMLGSLTGEMTDAQAERLSAQLLKSFAGGSAISVIKDLVKLPPVVMREMWRTPRGREIARQIAFREVSMAGYVHLPALVLTTETARQTAFGGQWSPAQEGLIWQMMEETASRYLGGKLNASQMAAMAMTWKGVTNFLGWGGLAPSLEPAYRAQLAYLFAHRYRALNKNDESLMFLRTAATDSEAGSALRRVAEEELAAMQ